MPLVTVNFGYPKRFVTSVPFVPVSGLQAVCAAFGREKGKHPNKKQTANSGLFRRASASDFPDFSPGQAERPAVLLPKRLNYGQQPEPTIITKGITKMSKKRRRDTTLTIRLTKAEKERIERNAKRAKQNLTDYIVLLSLETPIHVAEDVKPLLIELKRIGNNLNQIAAKINSGVFHSYDFQDVVDEQKKIYEQLLEIARKG